MTDLSDAPSARTKVNRRTYVRGVEDRAHREVDHAREQSKAMTVQLKNAGRQVEQSLRRQESLQTELSRVIRQRSAHDAGTNDNDSFAQSISHINLHSVDLKGGSLSTSGRFLLVVTGSSCRPESRCRFV